MALNIRVYFALIICSSLSSITIFHTLIVDPYKPFEVINRQNPFNIAPHSHVHVINHQPTTDPYVEIDVNPIPTDNTTIDDSSSPITDWHKAIGEQRVRYIDAIEDVPTNPLIGGVILWHQGRCGSTNAMQSLTKHLPLRGENVTLSYSTFKTEYLGDDVLGPPLWTRLGWGEFSRFKHTRLFTDPLIRLNEHELDVLTQEIVAMNHKRNMIPDQGRVTLTSVKIFYLCRMGIHPHDYLEALYRAGFRHMIVIHRSYLRVLLSSIGKWDNKRGPCDKMFLNVSMQGFCDPHDKYPLFDLYRQSDHAYRLAMTNPRFHDPLVLSYEKDFYHDSRKGVAKILRYLGQPYKQIVPQDEKYKQPSCPLKEKIINYDQVDRVFNGTLWHWALEPDGIQTQAMNPIQLLSLSENTVKSDEHSFLGGEI